MIKVHPESMGANVLLPRSEFDQLLALARRSDQIEIQTGEDELPAAALMRLAEEAGGFDWLSNEEDLYTIEDLKVRYR